MSLCRSQSEVQLFTLLTVCGVAGLEVLSVRKGSATLQFFTLTCRGRGCPDYQLEINLINVRNI